MVRPFTVLWPSAAPREFLASRAGTGGAPPRSPLGGPPGSSRRQLPVLPLPSLQRLQSRSHRPHAYTAHRTASDGLLLLKASVTIPLPLGGKAQTNRPRRWAGVEVMPRAGQIRQHTIVGTRASSTLAHRGNGMRVSTVLSCTVCTGAASGSGSPSPSASADGA